MPTENESRITNSALWAAAGDALGFMTELTDAPGLKWRIGTDAVTTTTRWRRSVGGKFGAVVDLPAGVYSDDTQLRLATSRAIRSDGQFDVEAFAKVELPVWMCYALGGGISTKAAAGALGHPDVNWYSNFFETRTAQYIAAGGNGAAMRIHPHVWSCKRLDSREYAPSIVRNALCTHGHMRGVFGAVFHGFCLAEALKTGDVPGPNTWSRGLDLASQIPHFVKQDSELSSFWLPVWESKANLRLDAACEAVRHECEDDINKLSDIRAGDGVESYGAALERLGCLVSENRGSGIKTALLAAWIAWIYREQPPLDILTRAVNVLSSDTDTIATMAGALLGAAAKVPPNLELMDRDYLASAATRLAWIAAGREVPNFRYPDLLSWKPPRTQLDAVGILNGQVIVAGLGEAEVIGTKYPARKTDGTNWQWLRLRFGQTILSKQRENLSMIQQDSSPPRKERTTQANLGKPRVRTSEQRALFDKTREAISNAPKTVHGNPTLDELTGEAIRSGFNPEVVGKHLLAFSEMPDGIEKALAYSSIVVKARRARLLSPPSERGNLTNTPKS